jgi:hypothetical protein
MLPLSLWGYDFVISKSNSVEPLDGLYFCISRLKLVTVVLVEIQFSWVDYALSTGKCLPAFCRILASVSSIDLAKHPRRTEF